MNDLDTLRTSAANLVSRLVEFLPTLLTALVLLIAGWLIARLIAAGVRRLATRFNFDSLLDRAGLLQGLRQAGVNRSPAAILGNLIFWIIFLNFLLIP